MLRIDLKSRRILVGSIAFCIVIGLLLFGYLRGEAKIINLQTYEMLLESGAIKKAVIQNNEVILYATNNRYIIVKDGIDLQKLLTHVPIEVKSENPLLADLVVTFILIGALFGLLVYARKRRQEEYVREEELRKSANMAYDPFAKSVIKASTTRYKFSDIAGIESVKEELQEVVDFLKNPLKYRKFGINLPKGVLLVGPPGVGKTMIAKAVAGEAEVPFFYQSGASFVQIYVGMGAKRVRELFSYAKANAPSIIFIDEIDAVGKARGGMRNDERESTLNELLTQMDGFEENSGVIVVGATNKIDVIDEALLRSGRFDRRIFIPMPDFEDRVKILEIYLREKPFEADIKEVARMSVGFSGAGLATLVNEAAINALREGRELISLDDFRQVKQKVLVGKRKSLNFSDEEKKIQATYQGAKALSAYWFEVDFDKITIVNDRLKDVDLEIESKSQMLAKIKVYLAGMCATKLLYNESFSNSHEDLSRAREIAKNMVELYGMGEALVPSNDDVLHILDEARKEVEKFLEGMEKPLMKVSLKLFEKESITKSELKEMVDELF
ncbi:MAG TPA: AAA family ATPase [Sulfurospirillum sp. UBA11407]|nr:MAG TPA: AAA family ATPase [Sulfurospirillum sp. UBA11407]